MPSIFLKALVKSPFFGGINLRLAERSVYKNFTFYTTSEHDELEEIYRIRYKVYCEEYRYLDYRDYPNKREQDIFDRHSIHLVVRHNSGDLAATARLILGSDDGLPILRNFEIDYRLQPVDVNQVAEISRLIVARNYRRKHLLLVLIKGIYLLVKERHLNNIFCVLDDKLTPNLEEFNIPITRIGKSKIFQGITAPYVIHVNEFEEKMYEKNRSLLKFLSNGSLSPHGKDYRYSLH